MNQTKKWYQSKTLWVGLLELLSPIGAHLVAENLIQESYVVAVCGLLTLALRLVTDNGIVK